MDVLEVTCGSCNHSLRVPARLAGRKVKCPKCGAAVEVGMLSSAGAAADEGSAPQPAAEHEAPAHRGKTAHGHSTSAARGARAHRTANAKKSPLPLVLGGAGAVLVA